MKILSLLVSVPIFLLFFSAPSFGAHGISIDGKLKYQENFSHFSYTSPEARKGGSVILHGIGSFDKMNPFSLKGEPPLGIERFVFDQLAVSSLDEPFTMYGLIAKAIEVADDYRSVVFTLNENARFSDGSPITVEDVAYTINTLKGDTVHPFYPYYYNDISEVEIIDQSRIRFLFSKQNRELPMIAAQIPVFSEKSFTTGGNSNPLSSPIGSGPYTVSDFKQGKYITYKRNEDYWAKDLPVRKNSYNFDTITVKFYRDQTVALEALKAGEFDFMSVNIAKQWARGLKGERFTNGLLKKSLIPHSMNAGMQGFLMNTRRPLFSDVRVRRAMGLAFDFEWSNRALFYDQYTRNDSFFSNSPYAAKDLPRGLELAYLLPYKDSIPPEVFSAPLRPVVTGDRQALRENLKAAMQLLKDAGWFIKDGALVNAHGEKFEFETILANQSFERIMAPFTANLKRLGINASYRTIDPALYSDRIKSFDFDMMVATYGQSQSPGNEQRNFWHSEAAAKQGSRNYAGIQSNAIDGMVERIIYAEDSEQLQAACRALDRLLWYGYYLIPNWYMGGYRLVYSSKFVQPDTVPLYFSPMDLLMTWWIEE